MGFTFNIFCFLLNFSEPAGERPPQGGFPHHFPLADQTGLFAEWRVWLLGRRWRGIKKEDGFEVGLF